MNLKEQLKNKLAVMKDMLDLAKNEKRSFTEDEETIYAKHETERDALQAKIETEETQTRRNAEMEALTAKLSAPANSVPRQTVVVNEVNSENGLRLFKNIGEQLRAIKNTAVNGIRDERLNRLDNEYKNAAQGMNENVDSEGGFAVQSDFAGMMMESAAKESPLISRVDSYTISGGADRVKWVDIDESDVSSTVFGGVQVYWATESATATKSKPVLMEKELKLEKLMGLAYATYELENDSTFISDLYTRAFTLGIRRKLEADIIAGTGVGRPLGITAGAGVVEVTKETGQVADTVVWENISKMYNRGLNKDSSSNYAWLAHPDVTQQFDFLNFPIGTGGVPVYLPAAQAGSVTTLKSKAVIESDHCKALGDAGDLIFTDLSQYLMIMKGGIDTATSMHVQFLTAENAFRFIFRANGMPKMNKSITIANSTAKRSAYVTLANRA